MKITCTGPNGERFEGHAQILISQQSSDPRTDRHNEEERACVQKALETWCATVKADPNTAEVKES